MSSRASVALSLEVPRRTVGELAGLAACLAAVLAGGAVGAAWQVPAGLGTLPALLAWLWFRRAHSSARPAAVASITWTADGAWRLRLRSGEVVGARLGPGTRVLRGSILFHWQTPLGVERLWLTRVDVGATALRRFAARLRSARELSADRRVYAVA